MLTGEYPGCRYVKYACRRYLDMLDMAKTGKYGFTFSEAHAIDVCAFAELLPLAEDNFRDIEFTELEPWQIFVLCALYGFRDGRGFRFVNECYLEVPRKNAKSVLATIIGLYDVRNERSRAPLVLIAASTLEQADRVFTPMNSVINGSDGMRPALQEATQDFRTLYKLEATKDIIRCGSTGGTIQKVASIGKRQDGWNPTTIILEELHAQNADVYQVLKSAIGSRGGQLLFQITTAGRDSFGLAWDNRKAAIKVLEGHQHDQDTLKQFAIIYTVDKEDLEDEKGNKRTEHLYQADAEQIWLKACPNLGVSFDMAAFHMLAAGARQKPLDREEFLRTRLNIWTNSASKIFDIEQFRRGARPNLKIEDFKGRTCWVAADLARVEDLASVTVIFEDDDEEPDDVVMFTKLWMSGDSQLLSDPDYVNMIKAWVESEKIEATREGGVDLNSIESHLRWLNKFFRVIIIGFDPAMAGQMMQNLDKDRIPVVPYMNRAVMMTAPIDDMIARAHTKSRSSLLYQENPAFEWCISNMHGERKKDGTIIPFKDAVDSLNKIDGGVSAAMANGLRLNPEYASKAKRPSVYNKRGLLGAQHVKSDGTKPGTDRPS